MADKESRITVDVRDKTGKSVGKVEFDASELAPRGGLREHGLKLPVDAA